MGRFLLLNAWLFLRQISTSVRLSLAIRMQNVPTRWVVIRVNVTRAS